MRRYRNNPVLHRKEGACGAVIWVQGFFESLPAKLDKLDGELEREGGAEGLPPIIHLSTTAALEATCHHLSGPPLSNACRNGAGCTRPDCYFNHPDGWFNGSMVAKPLKADRIDTVLRQMLLHAEGHVEEAIIPPRILAIVNDPDSCRDASATDLHDNATAFARNDPPLPAGLPRAAEVVLSLNDRRFVAWRRVFQEMEKRGHSLTDRYAAILRWNARELDGRRKIAAYLKRHPPESTRQDPARAQDRLRQAAKASGCA